jgi:long-chain acyl-CoA synthetase
VSYLLEDLTALRPTIFVGVPRILNKIHDKILQTAHGSTRLRSLIFNKAIQSKIAAFESSGTLKHAVWDALVFRKVRSALGGRIKHMASSSAPISPDVLKFLKVAFGCHIIEGIYPSFIY